MAKWSGCRVALLRLSLAVRFAALSALVVATVAVALHATLQQVMENRARQDTVRSAEFVTHLTIEPILDGVDLTAADLPGAQRDKLDAVVRRGIDQAVLGRIKIFDRNQRVVYSDNPDQIGQRYPSSHEVRTALAGRSDSEFASVVEREHHGERGLGLLLEAVVPLSTDADSRPDGVVELYVPYAPVQAAVQQDSRRFLLILAVGLITLWEALYRIVRTASRRLSSELARNRHHALHDSLTGLPNRGVLFDRLEAAISSSRSTGSVAAVLLFDLNGFKDVNDTLGHHAGDVLLRQVAQRLCTGVPAVDTVARLGGDEFAVVLIDLPDMQALHGAADRLRVTFAEPFGVVGTQVRVTPSIGAAVVGRDGEAADDLLRKADAAMYAAKRAGGGVAHYDAARDDAAARLVALKELRHAIEHGELVLHYQPSVRLHDRFVTGAEALVRWEHPIRGLLQPGQFIPLAEQSELIGPLTAWVIDEAMRQCRRWLDDGLDLCVAVNLSARSVVDEQLPSLVGDALRRHSLPPDRVVFEITETSLISRPEDAKRILSELCGLGVNLAVDDFGTGYATLAVLQQLPFNALKIDRGFVADVTTDGPGAELVRYTTQLAHAMDKVVVAEGVESAQQWLALERMGCDHAQGYAISRPLGADEFDVWLQQWHSTMDLRIAAVVQPA